ncbi:hypothetical protein NP493_2589g00001 [Ridgeia piscesae]|uniref:Uncharacterized protein n=1 Tax=Ridgeia piscesae TaxID=27915 RepID=A0AAD9JEG0_RIDPI|nr:hypothetical protein NP493_2589g00001 [Ridgeia piscesae]
MATPSHRRLSRALTPWLAVLTAVLSVTLSPVTSIKTKPWLVETVTYTRVESPNWAQSCIASQTFPCK